MRSELDHERGQVAQTKAALSGEMATLVETRTAQIEQLTHERQTALDERAEALRRIEELKTSSERDRALAATRATPTYPYSSTQAGKGSKTQP